MIVQETGNIKKQIAALKNSVSLFLFFVFILFSYSVNADDCSKKVINIDAFECLQNKIEKLSEFLSENVSNVTATVADNTSKIAQGSIPKGTIVLFETPCPTEAFVDLTNDLNGYYLFVDSSVNSNASTIEKTGAHNHKGGSHAHPIKGQTGKIGGGTYKTTKNGQSKAVPLENNTASVEGKALEKNKSIDSSHSHNGGIHGHNRAGFRLCRKN